MSSYAESEVFCEETVLPSIPVLQDPNDDEAYTRYTRDFSQIIQTRERMKTDLLEKQEEFRIMLVEMERTNRFLKTKVWTLETHIEEHKKLNSFLKSRVCKLDSQVDCLLTKLNKAHATITKMQHELDMKDSYIKRGVLEKRKLVRAYCNKLRTEIARITNESEAKLEEQRKCLESCIKEKDDKLNFVKKVLLSDENFDHVVQQLSAISRTNTEAAEEFVSSTPTRQPFTSTPQDLKAPTVRITSTDNTTADISTKSDTEVTKTDNSNSAEPSRLCIRDIPVVNTRYRSLSTSKLISHRPTRLVPVGTILQPQIPHKPVTKLVNPKSFMDKSAKYCLFAQEQDTDGQLETKLYKADVLPTSGGGAQIVFNDVECLKQMSPK